MLEGRGRGGWGKGRMVRFGGKSVKKERKQL